MSSSASRVEAAPSVSTSALENPYYQYDGDHDALLQALQDAAPPQPDCYKVPLRTRKHNEQMMRVAGTTGEEMAQNGTKFTRRPCPGFSGNKCYCQTYPGFSGDPSTSLIECLDEAEERHLLNTGELPTKPQLCVLCTWYHMTELMSVLRSEPTVTYTQSYRVCVQDPTQPPDPEMYGEHEVILPNDRNGLVSPIVDPTQICYAWAGGQLIPMAR